MTTYICTKILKMKKKIIITGSSSGIGLATTKAYLDLGYQVFGLSRSEPPIIHTNFQWIHCDVRKVQELEKQLLHIIEQAKTIDYLINNAGVGYFDSIENISNEQWNEIQETNIGSIFHCSKIIVPIMKTQEFGHIVNIASTAGLEGMPQVTAYCASKWAVKGFSEALWRELREYNIKVSCIYPGSTYTHFFDNHPTINCHNYMLQPEDISSAILFMTETPDHVHPINFEVRPLHPKGRKNKQST